ncbi:MAG: hypothetical protein ACN4GF_04400 [Lentimonas sp.]
MNILSEAFFFPLRNSSLKVYFGLCGLLVLQYGIALLPIISLLNIAFFGYVYATQFKIIFTTGNGYADAPNFPEFNDAWGSMLVPLLKMAGVWIIAFIPCILVIWLLNSSNEMLYWAMVVVALTYIPIGLMIVAMDSFEKALNPILVVQSIRKIGIMYLTIVITLLILRVVLDYIDEAFTGSWVISSLFGAYGIMFTGRLIGSAYREYLSNEIFDSNIREM